MDLPRAPAAGAIARRQLSNWFAEAVARDELQEAKLLCSELVNNAVVHGRGEIRLQVGLDENRLRLEVIDEGDGFEHVVRQIPCEALSGRGLAIVEAESSRWGIHEGATHVWAEIERSGPRVGEEAKPDR